MNPKYPFLDLIAQNRNGGIINIQGITYQFKYSCFRILSITNNVTNVKLEGVEDVDIVDTIKEKYTLIQLKYSLNKLQFSKLKQNNAFVNFLEVYLQDTNAEIKFKIVTNNQFDDKKLIAIQNQKFSKNDLDFWDIYIKELKNKFKLWNWSKFVLAEFLKKIEFEIISEETIDAKNENLIIQNHNIFTDNTRLFISEIFHNIFNWTRNKTTISQIELNQIIQDTKEDISKGFENEAIKYKWISEIKFSPNNNSDHTDYFEGRPAKPIHIIQLLPARRKNLEIEIEKSIFQNNITVIKASSGQGKSTMAWQVSYNLFQKNYSIFELIFANEKEKLSHIVDFLKAKIRTGFQPILVIDGLSELNKNWAIIAEELSQLGIKIVITTREEDWKKFGTEVYKSSMGFPNISLGYNEAKDIYAQLEKKGYLFLDANIAQKPFQFYWEQIKDKGLLIEYIFLITQGKMLESRLREQIKAIVSEGIYGLPKLEILKLISLANCSNIRINKLALNDHLNKRKFHQVIEINTLYDSLEKEYSINFENEYIEGLHPVRSKNILNILHENSPLIESVGNLSQIIEPVDFYPLFSFFPKQLTQINYNYLSHKIIDLPVYSLVNAIEGLFAYELNTFWASNKEFFDKIYNTGGGMLFNACLMPFPQFEALEILSENNEFIKNILKEIKLFENYDFQKSELKKFVTIIHKNINLKAKHIDNIEGLSKLKRWYDIFELKYDLELDINDSEFLKYFDLYPINEVASFMEICFELNQSRYEEFLNLNLEKLISILKVKTDTPTIEIRNNELFSEYVYLFNSDLEPNIISTTKLSIFINILSGFSKYNTKAVVLEFPSVAIAKFAKNDSEKSFSKENLFQKDKVRINIIWIDEIEKNYISNSEFEWQGQIIEMRTNCLNFVKTATGLIEGIIDNLPKLYEKQYYKYVEYVNIIEGLKRSLRARPEYKASRKDDSFDYYKKNDSKIKSWEYSISSIINLGINELIINENNDNLNQFIYNLKSSYDNLLNMHIAFDDIQKSTFTYFNTQELKRDEISSYSRL
ncbi:MAG: hypothetical protein V4683_09710, partial [Bacteroidota bacterium]